MSWCLKIDEARPSIHMLRSLHHICHCVHSHIESVCAAVASQYQRISKLLAEHIGSGAYIPSDLVEALSRRFPQTHPDLGPVNPSRESTSFTSIGCGCPVCCGSVSTLALRSLETLRSSTTLGSVVARGRWSMPDPSESNGRLLPLILG